MRIIGVAETPAPVSASVMCDARDNEKQSGPFTDNEKREFPQELLYPMSVNILLVICPLLNCTVLEWRHSPPPGDVTTRMDNAIMHRVTKRANPIEGQWVITHFYLNIRASSSTGPSFFQPAWLGLKDRSSSSEFIEAVQGSQASTNKIV